MQFKSTMSNYTLDQLANALSAGPTSAHHWIAQGEFKRRELEGQQETARYQIMAAEAEVKAAEATAKGADAAEKNAWYMLMSVIVAAVAAIASAISAIVAAYPVWIK
jgi:hypothetical protein